MACIVILLLLAINLNYILRKEDGFYECYYVAMTNLHNPIPKHIRYYSRGNARENTKNNNYRMILLLLILLGGDIESHPGPVSLQQYRDMNAQQRKGLLKDDIAQLLSSIADTPQEEISLETIMIELRGIKADIAELKNVKTTVDENKKKIEIMEKEIKSQREILQQQQRFLEKLDNGERYNKLVILGVAENDRTADNDVIDELLELLGVKNDVQVSQVKRLGTRREQDRENPVIHKRPILVTVTGEGMRNTVLKNAKKLKDVTAESKFHKVFIKADEHPAVRAEMQRLYNVFKAEKTKPENVGVEIKFDRKARKVMRNGEEIDKFGLISFFR